MRGDGGTRVAVGCAEAQFRLLELVIDTFVLTQRLFIYLFAFGIWAGKGRNCKVQLSFDV